MPHHDNTFCVLFYIVLNHTFFLRLKISQLHCLINLKSLFVNKFSLHLIIFLHHDTRHSIDQNILKNFFMSTAHFILFPSTQKNEAFFFPSYTAKKPKIQRYNKIFFSYINNQPKHSAKRTKI